MSVDLSKLKGSPVSIAPTLINIISKFDDEIDQAEQRLSMIGKTGAQALREQSQYPIMYGIKKAECEKVLKFIDSQMKAARSRALRRLLDNNQRDIGERARDKFIDSDAEYLAYYELYIEVEEIHEKLSAVYDAFDKRGFALRDWTQLKIASLEREII